MDNYTIRRLTPTECERLMGYPDGWTDIGDWVDSQGKKHKGDSDTPRYKALGNSIVTSLPNGQMSYWAFVLRRISAKYDRYPTMASLFDGIGGFPLIWEQINGKGSTLWASEIEEFPIAVTKRHFPLMQHLGDITKINGAEVPKVDCIIGGSPCQDLSVAGARAGLAGERSGLFMEQIRIIKEMRENDRYAGRTGDLVRPRYAVWENVPGAFSSNGGEDFRAVLEEFCKIGGGSVNIPRPKKWLNSGVVMGDGFSVAYTVFDSKNWSVAQRRKRICVVADFSGQSAAEILFESSVCVGHPQPSVKEGTGVAGDTDEGVSQHDKSSSAWCVGNGQSNEVCHPIEDCRTLNTMHDPMTIVQKGIDWYQHNGFRESETSGPVTTGCGRVRGGYNAYNGNISEDSEYACGSKGDGQ